MSGFNSTARGETQVKGDRARNPFEFKLINLLAMSSILAPNRPDGRWLKKKRSPEETLDGLHTGGRRHQPRGSCGLVQKS